jgi:hypothetical protein
VRLVWSSYLGDDCLRLTGSSPRALGNLRAMTQSDRARRIPVYPTELVRSAVGASNLQSVGGRYEVDGESVCLVPSYPFLAGTSYTVLVHHSLDRDNNVTTFELEDFEALTIARLRDEGAEPTTRVVAIYPTADELPRNQLRFYIHFSSPMSEGFVAEHVHVVDAETREPLTKALLPMEPELWDRERMRATVLFDPARIKRGLAPNREAGYPLREGVAIEVVVDDGFADAEGRPLAASSVRRYRVESDVRRRIEPQEWELCAPATGTRDPIVVRFDRPLDHALLQRCLTVVDAETGRLSGRVGVAAGERSWEFTPFVEWRDARYALVVDTMLEDLAGNSVARVFDRDLADADHTPIAAGDITLEFLPASSAI